MLKKVPGLLTSGMRKSIDRLINSREHANVKLENPYVFAINNVFSKKCLRGHNVLSKVCKEADLKKSSLITSTSMQTYVATDSQVVYMDNNKTHFVPILIVVLVNVQCWQSAQTQN